jgi:hypothetical protein
MLLPVKDRGKYLGGGCPGMKVCGAVVEFNRIIGQACTRHELIGFLDCLKSDCVGALMQITAGKVEDNIGMRVHGIVCGDTVAHAGIEFWLKIKPAGLSINADLKSRHAGGLNQQGNMKAIG